MAFLSFFAVVLNDYNALFIFMEELSYMLTKDFVSCVHVRLYFVTAAHFHLAGRYHFSFSHHRYEIFMFIFHRNSSPSFLITRSSSFSVIHVSVNIKNNVEKDTTLLLFFLSKSPGRQQAAQAQCINYREFRYVLHITNDLKTLHEKLNIAVKTQKYSHEYRNKLNLRELGSVVAFSV